MPVRACLSTLMAFSMRSSTSIKMSSAPMVVTSLSVHVSPKRGARVPACPSLALRANESSLRLHRRAAADDRANLLAVHGPLDVPFLAVVEHQDRHVVLHALRDGRRV